jgi:glycosyltransferase-like protein
MKQSRRLRIAILTHSTNPRGGVVHALSLGEALTQLGHEAVVHAPDAKGSGFFRSVRCETICVPAWPVVRDTLATVQSRVGDYVRYFQDNLNRRFDVFHAHDGISGNALATLAENRLIETFARTIHHIDTFDDPRVTALQTRSIVKADRHFVVSALWRDMLRQDFGLASTIVGNGVDLTLFGPTKDGNEARLADRLGVKQGPIFLSIGGVEERKNTIHILQAFMQVHMLVPQAQLIIVGGATVLDHSAYRAKFDQVLRQSGLPDGTVLRLGPISQAEIGALYRLATALVFPSIKEGFGLTVIEAMASGLPVVTSAIPPFTDYLESSDVVWCDPQSPGSIANAMMLTTVSQLSASLVERGLETAKRHSWTAAARAHLPVYQDMHQNLGALQHA